MNCGHCWRQANLGSRFGRVKAQLVGVSGWVGRKRVYYTYQLRPPWRRKSRANRSAASFYPFQKEMRTRFLREYTLNPVAGLIYRLTSIQKGSVASDYCL